MSAQMNELLFKKNSFNTQYRQACDDRVSDTRPNRVTEPSIGSALREKK